MQNSGFSVMKTCVAILSDVPADFTDDGHVSILSHMTGCCYVLLAVIIVTNIQLTLRRFTYERVKYRKCRHPNLMHSFSL